MPSNTRISLFAAIAAFSIVASATALHATTEPANTACIFDTYAIRSVAPLRVEVNVGYGSYSTLRGAQLYIDAREGLTAEWLTLRIANALGSPVTGEAKTCRPAVPNVKVDVVSAGSGFWIQLSAADGRTSETLLHWAQAQHAARTR